MLGGRSCSGAEVEAIRDPNYFLKQIQRCEQNFSETMQWKIAKPGKDDVGPDFGFWVVISWEEALILLFVEVKGYLVGVRLGG